MAGSRDRIGAIVRQTVLREDGVVGIGHERAEGTVRAIDLLLVVVTGAATSRTQEVVAVDLVDVRAFDVVSVERLLVSAIDQQHVLGQRRESLGIHFHHPDRGVRRVTLGRRFGVVDDVHAPIVVEEERRIDALDMRQPDGIAPVTGRVTRGGNEISTAAYAGGDQVEGAGVMTNARRIDTTAIQADMLIERHHVRAINHVAHLRPIHQVMAVEHRDARVVTERGIYQVIVATCTRNAGVRMETGEDRILESSCSWCRIEQRIGACVLDPLEHGFVGRHGMRHRDDHQSGDKGRGKQARDDIHKESMQVSNRPVL